MKPQESAFLCFQIPLILSALISLLRIYVDWIKVCKFRLTNVFIFVIIFITKQFSCRKSGESEETYENQKVLKQVYPRPSCK